jgi:hypothetical protein
MNNIKKNERPNCDEILSNKRFWSLSLSELQNDREFKSKEIVFSDVFLSHFIEIKSKILLNSSKLKKTEKYFCPLL